MKTCLDCGEPTGRAHQATRCLACAQARQLERVVRWGELHPERLREVRREHKRANAAHTAEQWRRYYEKNRSELLAKRREWARANPDKKRAARDRDKMRADGRRRRARLAAVEHEDYTDAEIYDRDGGRCRSCGIELSLDPKDFEIDHIVPIVLGGPNTRANVQLLCVPCNRQKWTRLEGQIHLPV